MGQSAFGAPLPPDADFWYSTPGYTSNAGQNVSPDTAMRSAAVYACVRVCSSTVASLPCVVYKRLPDGGKERAVDHPLYDVLHEAPNDHQTSYEFFELMQAHLELRGNAFARIVSGPRGAVDQLMPIHPDRVQVYREPDGMLKYQVRSWYDGSVEWIMQPEMLHIRGLSSNGIVGTSPIALAMEVIGGALGQQEYGNRFLANDSKPSWALSHPGKLKPEAYQRLRADIAANQTGANRHKVMLLEEGMTPHILGINNRESQFLEARQYTRGEIASIFGVPPHKIGDLTRATFSNIEHQSVEFLTDCVRPRLVRIERRINMDLIEPLEVGDDSSGPDEYFCEFGIDALLRGDQKARYEAYEKALFSGWLSVNEVRAMENRNPIGPAGDEYIRPMNMGPTGKPKGDGPPVTPQPEEGSGPADPSPSDTSDGTSNAELVLKDMIKAAAERCVRKETKALRTMEAKAAGSITALAAQIDDFYLGHADFIMETLRVTRAAADAYVSGSKALLGQRGGIDQIENGGAGVLADLALGDHK